MHTALVSRRRRIIHSAKAARVTNFSHSYTLQHAELQAVAEAFGVLAQEETKTGLEAWLAGPYVGEVWPCSWWRSGCYASCFQASLRSNIAGRIIRREVEVERRTTVASIARSSHSTAQRRSILNPDLIDDHTTRIFFRILELRCMRIESQGLRHFFA